MTREPMGMESFSAQENFLFCRKKKNVFGFIFHCELGEQLQELPRKCISQVSVGLWKKVSFGWIHTKAWAIGNMLCEACVFHECGGWKAVVVPKNYLSIDVLVNNEKHELL